MYSEADLIGKCLKNEPKAQAEFYKRFAPKMYGVCIRFAKNKMEADDILQEGFIKVFFNLKSYRGDGALEGWVRRTIVNTAINYYKRNLKYQNDLEIEKADSMHSSDNGILDSISANDLINLVQELPVGYRMVFNLNVIEGYTHKEIAKILNISENTSKSQLSRARQSLQAKVNELNRVVY